MVVWAERAGHNQQIEVVPRKLILSSSLDERIFYFNGRFPVEERVHAITEELPTR